GPRRGWGSASGPGWRREWQESRYATLGRWSERRTSSGRCSRSWSTNLVESRNRGVSSEARLAPQSAASIVKAPKHEAEGVTIGPFESRRLATSDVFNLQAPAKSPALAEIRPQHH